jgi:DNA-binding response OmpR family regulator
VAGALKQSERRQFNLYILDHNFPDGTGTQFCKEIRRFDNRTPIIIYSGTSTTSSDFEEAISAGAQDYILKPHIEELLERIATLLGGSR